MTHKPVTTCRHIVGVVEFELNDGRMVWWCERCGSWREVARTDGVAEYLTNWRYPWLVGPHEG